jgi:RND family efflux transporter MFP subunit
MTTKQSDITALSRSVGVARTVGVSVPKPPRRLLTHVGVPLVIFAVALVLLAYAARDALTPAVEVRVAPVVLKDAPASRGSTGLDTWRAPDTVVAQGPGWIEPAPFAISVQALTDGVISEVLALEGEHVEKGQVVARMIADEARLGAERARSEVALARAEVERAGEAAAAAKARADEIRDELERKRPLVDAGGISEGQLARLELRLRAAEHEGLAASAAHRGAQANVAKTEAMFAEAELRLSRMEVRSPASGVVMTRAVEPGTRIAMAGPGPGEGHGPGLFRIYDPEQLQVRVDVPLADAAKVGLGDRAEVTTEAIPDRAFRGEVVRVVHEADIQRNTVEVKVLILDPATVLKPEMLARVRFFASDKDGEASTEPNTHADAPTLVAAPTAALFEETGTVAKVWVIDRGSGRGVAKAAIRTVTLAGREGDDTLIRDGLRPGDRVILQPPVSLSEGDRVRVASTTN